MSRVQRNKLVFIETRDSGEISLALKNYFTVSTVIRSFFINVKVSKNTLIMHIVEITYSFRTKIFLRDNNVLRM